MEGWVPPRPEEFATCFFDRAAAPVAKIANLPIAGWQHAVPPPTGSRQTSRLEACAAKSALRSLRYALNRRALFSRSDFALRRVAFRSRIGGACPPPVHRTILAHVMTKTRTASQTGAGENDRRRHAKHRGRPAARNVTNLAWDSVQNASCAGFVAGASPEKPEKSGLAIATANALSRALTKPRNP
jgi:hypothetical protein